MSNADRIVDCGFESSRGFKFFQITIYHFIFLMNSINSDVCMALTAARVRVLYRTVGVRILNPANVCCDTGPLFKIISEDIVTFTSSVEGAGNTLCFKEEYYTRRIMIHV